MKKSAIILAAIMLLSSFEPVVATEKSTAESKKVKWMLENDFVAGRGQTKDLKLEDTITRAEFTRMILVIKGEENIAKEDSTSKADFKDVPNTHWAEKFIVYAKQKGYISGYPDGNFRPEGEITYEEMISILARIHPNYRKIEAKSTNWAEGFINFAKDNGILDDINIKESYKSPAIREKTFEMTYNFIKFVENQTKSEKVSKIKEEKDVKKENSTWNEFYPYWLGYGFRPIVEEKPEVKPNPDVKPVPDKHEEPGTPEKENPSEPGTQPETPGEENPTEPGTEPEAPKVFDPDHVEKMVVKEQPTNLIYTEGEKLNLAGLEVTLTDNQGLTKNVAFKDFATYGITAEPTNDTELKLADNGSKVKLTKGKLTAETEALTVLEKVVGPKDPTKPDGKNPDANKYWTVKFESADTAKGTVAAENTFYILKTAGKTLADLKDSAPAATAIGNNKFDGWVPALDTNTAIDQDRTIKAQFSAKVFDSAHVEKMGVKTQPTNLIYTEGEKLNLAGLEVTLTDNQGLTKDVAFKDFAANGITTEPENNKQLTESENNTKIKIKRGDKEAITGNISLTLKVISKADFEKENKIKTSIKNSLVEVYKSLGYIKLGIDNLHNKYYLLFTKDANDITFDKNSLKTSILNTIKNNKIKSYTIGETNRELLDGENYKSDETILGFIREDILKLAGLEGNPSATDTQILEKLEVTKPNSNIKLVVGDDINLDYEIIFLTQMAEEKLNQIETDFVNNMKDTSKIVENENKEYRVSYNNKYYLVEHKFAIRKYNISYLAKGYGYDIVLTNFLTGGKLGESKSLKELKSFMVHTIRNSKYIDNRGIMDSMELQALLGGGDNYREITESYHGTFRRPNKYSTIIAENLESSKISLEYFYTDEASETGGIITRTIYYRYY